ncbi:MAG TPA: DUF6265 family protein [Caulobacteraceae bacterium]|jgi:hypothetical protein|nr:DUF6265 family protein [Caulobacteraceae bacterium]
MTPAAFTAAGIAVLSLGFAGLAQAQDIRALAPGATPAAATLDDLKGLTGEWAGAGASVGFSAPAAGEVVGHFMTYNDTGPRAHALWIFRPEGASVLLRQKHYDPALIDREAKDKWAERRLVAIDPGHIFLEDLTWVTKGDVLDLYIRTPGQNGGPPTVFSYALHRVR